MEFLVYTKHQTVPFFMLQVTAINHYIHKGFTTNWIKMINSFSSVKIRVTAAPVVTQKQHEQLLVIYVDNMNVVPVYFLKFDFDFFFIF